MAFFMLAAAGSVAAQLPAYPARSKSVDALAIRGPLRDYSGDRLWTNNYPQAPVDGQVIAQVRAVCLHTCIWFGRASAGGVVRDAELTRTGRAGYRSIDAGIKIGGSKGGVPTAGILIERVYSHGWQQVPHKGYANGDGIVINRGVRDVTIRDSRLDDNADAGLDSKADMVTLDNVSASANGHYGFRFWGGARATTLTSIDNAWGAIEAEAGARVVIERLVMIGDQELVTTKAGAEVEIKSCDLSRWTGTEPTKGPGRVILVEGCRGDSNIPKARSGRQDRPVDRRD